MRILQVGLDKTTLAFLRERGIVIEDSSQISGVEDIEAWIEDGRCEAIVIDLAVQGFGLYAARHLRNKKIHTPVIGISHGSSGHSWPDERATFLENGGDDLIRGPANPRELTASLRAMSRRFNGAVMSIVEVQAGQARLKVNLSTRSILINGREPLLSHTEQEMILFIAAHPGRCISKETLLDNLYALRPDDPPEIKIIDVFICKARKKMGEIHPDAEKLIETVWGQGYRLASDSAAQTAA